ncbi:MAG: protein-L-isoaspartate(D-aspartate) O-methyltransferase [Flavobacteriales bacterium]|nr:protein-L-isoaspartate(D-aspartate) O-methyltransferase [Flavobacteriales bacterium]
MEDSYRDKGLRKQLLAELRQKGITDERVLAAMDRIPRHLFVDSAFKELSYRDMALRIGAGQTISQPYTVAFQTQLLQIEKTDKVLEVGTGSGYQAAVLAEMGVRVFTIERQKELYESSKTFLPKLNPQYKIRFFYGDGYKGIPAYAPYDKIIVTCGAPYIPEELIKQLKPGGKAVIPVGEGEVQKMTLLTKNENGEIHTEEKGDFRFVPMLENKAGNGF